MRSVLPWYFETDPATPYPERRCFVWAIVSGDLVTVAPAAGGDIDGVSADEDDLEPAAGANHPGPRVGYSACPGQPCRVEAGGSFSAGASLETTATGKVVAVSTGKAILRALEASTGDGAIVRAVFTSGR